MSNFAFYHFSYKKAVTFMYMWIKSSAFIQPPEPGCTKILFDIYKLKLWMPFQKFFNEHFILLYCDAARRKIGRAHV